MPGNQPIQIRVSPDTLKMIDAAKGAQTRAQYVRAALHDRLMGDAARALERRKGGCDLSKVEMEPKSPIKL